jgi:peroxiredoxin
MNVINLSAILILLFIISCSKIHESEKLTFQFDKPATLIINYIPDSSEHTIVGRYSPFLSPDYVNNYKFTDKLTISNQSNFFLNYKISNPTDTDLILDSKLWIPLILVPGDTLFLTLNLSDSSKIIEQLEFDGKNATINDYQIKRHKHFKERYSAKCASLSRSNKSIIELQNAIDSITTEELDYFNNYIKDNPLPNWYVYYEKNQIIYRGSFDKTYKINSWKWANFGKNAPANSYDFIDNIKVNNQEALISDQYYYFLYQYFDKFLPNDIYTMEVSKRRKILGLKYLEISDSILSGEVKEVFQTFILSQFVIDMGMNQIAEEIISEQKLKKKGLSYVEYLEKYLNDKSTLKSGEEAPQFYLMTTNKDYVSLSDFRNSILLLNFWFPGCKGCVMEIPHETKLVEKLTGKKFSLINICLHASEDNWIKALKTSGMKGVNLFANEKWQQNLIESYKISFYPHYTLINKDGKIISNNPKRPSENILEDINYLLRE